MGPIHPSNLTSLPPQPMPDDPNGMGISSAACTEMLPRGSPEPPKIAPINAIGMDVYHGTLEQKAQVTSGCPNKVEV